ncbi:hypothetical protein PT2222_110134 [Paraburkholderia tropica]
MPSMSCFNSRICLAMSRRKRASALNENGRNGQTRLSAKVIDTQDYCARVHAVGEQLALHVQPSTRGRLSSYAPVRQ